MYITIFKTSVQQKDQLNIIGPILDHYIGVKNWNFAFEDEDKILRVVSVLPCAIMVTRILNDGGFICQEWPYSLDEFNVAINTLQH